MREKLIELLDGWDCPILLAVCEAESLADFLIANGVTVREMGRWYIRIDDYDCEYMVCSACGTDFFDGENDTVDYKPNFCPVCGADMRGEEHERNMFELLKEKEQRRRETFPYIVIGLPDAPKDGE